MDHAGSLAHAADRDGLSVQFDLYRNLFFYRIRRHDRLCRQRTGSLTRSKHWLHCFNSGTDLVDRNLCTDHAGRCHQHLFRLNPKKFRCFLCRLFTIAKTFFSCARVCHAAVRHDRMDALAAVNDTLIPFHRRCLYHICCKSTSHLTRRLTVDHRHVLFPFFNTGRDTGRCKALRGGYAAIYFFYHKLLRF